MSINPVSSSFPLEKIKQVSIEAPTTTTATSEPTSEPTSYYPSQQETYPNGEPMYVDGDGCPVNSSGQLVDPNTGNPEYQHTWTDGQGTHTETVYWGYGYNPYTDQDEWRYWHMDGGASHWGSDTYTPMYGDGEVIPVYDDSLPPGPVQETYPNGDPKYVDSDGNNVNSNGLLVDENGDVLPKSPTGGPPMGSGDPQPVYIPTTNTEETIIPTYDTSAPDEMLDPYNPYGTGNDIYSKTNLWLEWLQAHPENSNGAEDFLLYLSNVCGQADEYPPEQFNEFAGDIAGIQNSEGKTLVAECVDITMEQMVLNGYTPEQAHDAIYALFPPEQTDPISVAARAEADKEYDVMTAPGYENPDQEEIQQEWYDYITDPSVTASIDDTQAEIMGDMIDGCGDNIYAALIVILLYLEAAGITNLNAYGDLSNELADETDDLNEIITEWDDGTAMSSPEAAQEWMEECAALQEEINGTAFDQETLDGINKQFDSIYDQQAMGGNYHSPQETYPNGDLQYTCNGKNTNSDGQLVDDQGRPLYTQSGKDTRDGDTTVYWDPNGPDGAGYYYESTGERASTSSTYTPQTETGTVTPVYNTAQPEENYPVQLTYPNGEPQFEDANGNAVNSSGQLVDENGDPEYNGQSPMMGTGDPTPVTVNGDIYLDTSTGNTYYRTDDGVYIDTTTNRPATTQPDSENVVELTIGMQAFGYTDSNGNHVDPNASGDISSEGLQTSFQAFQEPGPLDPANPSQTGFPEQQQNILMAEDAISTGITTESSALVPMMQTVAGNIEKFENAFSSMISDSSSPTSLVGLQNAINQNMRG